jgi:hypothetical protein
MKAPTACPFCEITHKVTVPSVSLNGTSPEALMEQYQPALEAVHTALEALGKCAPNARDYQGKHEQWNNATMAHVKRWDYLQEIRVDLWEIRDHIQAVMDFKANQARKTSK